MSESDTDIEARVSEVLTRRAQRPVEVERLRANAIQRAAAIRRRRLAAGASAVTACVLATVAAAAGLVGFSGGTLPQSTLTPSGQPQSILPLETAAPPGGIGSDPALLHFDFDPSVFHGAAGSIQWVSGIGYEAVHVYRGEENPWVDINLDPTEAARTARLRDRQAIPMPGSGEPDDAGRQVFVAGRPALLQRSRFLSGTGWLLRWEPAPQVYAAMLVPGPDEELAVPVAEAMRFDRVQRCVMPLRLNELPARASWHECQTRLQLEPPRWIYSGLTIERAGAKPILIWADGRRGIGHAAAFQADQMVRGYLAQWLSGSTDYGTGLWIPDFGAIDLFITSLGPREPEGISQEDARWLAQRLRPSTNTTDPASWPARAVG